jgi:hypothetical protein
MSYLAIIAGLSGADFYLDAQGAIQTDQKRARRFRSEGSAKDAAALHIARQHPSIARHLTYRIEEVTRGQ